MTRFRIDGCTVVFVYMYVYYNLFGQIFTDVVDVTKIEWMDSMEANSKINLKTDKLDFIKSVQ